MFYHGLNIGVGYGLKIRVEYELNIRVEYQYGLILQNKKFFICQRSRLVVLARPPKDLLGSWAWPWSTRFTKDLRMSTVIQLWPLLPSSAVVGRYWPGKTYGLHPSTILAMPKLPNKSGWISNEMMRYKNSQNIQGQFTGVQRTWCILLGSKSLWPSARHCWSIFNLSLSQAYHQLYCVALQKSLLSILHHTVTMLYGATLTFEIIRVHPMLGCR